VLPPSVDSSGDPRAVLAQAAQALGLSLSAAQLDALLAYLALIQKWNKVYNLTALRDPQDMLTHHLVDSLAVVVPLQRQLADLRAQAQECTQVRAQAKAQAQTPIQPQEPQDAAPPQEKEQPQTQGSVVPAAGQGAGQRLLDVGSGAGLPGVVIAICCPGLVVHCVDTVGKKAAFVQQAAVALKLPRLRGIHARVESLTDTYDVVSSRAFASLVDFTTWSAQALAPHGVWMGMKGKHPHDEVAALPPSVQVFHVEPLAVPLLDAERCIVWMRKAACA
jgi:16S rRNA (guanine527-N7)-methyltransferase